MKDFVRNIRNMQNTVTAVYDGNWKDFSILYISTSFVLPTHTFFTRSSKRARSVTYPPSHSSWQRSFSIRLSCDARRTTLFEKWQEGSGPGAPKRRTPIQHWPTRIGAAVCHRRSIPPSSRLQWDSLYSHCFILLSRSIYYTAWSVGEIYRKVNEYIKISPKRHDC